MNELHLHVGPYVLNVVVVFQLVHQFVHLFLQSWVQSGVHVWQHGDVSLYKFVFAF